MSYIITAEVYFDSEENLGCSSEEVLSDDRLNVRILSRRDGIITFDTLGDFHRQQEIVSTLCQILVDAGFLSFCIGHSY